jgi:drug/metabolite transporter (DMT)-like permease
MRSIAGSISLVANFYAMTHLPVSDVLTVTNIFPLWVALLSWPLLGTKPAPDTWIAACIGVIGVIMVQQPHFAEGGLALAACVLSSFTSAIALIGLHQLQGLDSRAVVTHFSGVSLVFCGAAAVVFPLEQGGGIPTVPLTWVLLAALATAATAGQIMLTKAFAAGPPARVSVVNLSQVGMAALMEVIFLGRSFSTWTMLGMALVLAPTAWVLLRRLPAAELLREDAESTAGELNPIVVAECVPGEPAVLPSLPSVPPSN